MIQKLIILGETNDDKGKQLEELTEFLLSRDGCTEIKRNPEYDISGELDLTAKKSLDNGNVIQIICECKAYTGRKKVNIEDWLKFLGKYYGELQKDSSTHGVFISLSGVNGRVEGAVSALMQQKVSIEVWTGEKLFSLVHNNFNLISETVARQIIMHYTNRVIHEICIAYYDKEVYWFVFFKDCYTILACDGKVLDDSYNGFIQNAAARIKLPYINLIDENTGIWNRILINRVVLLVILSSEERALSLDGITTALNELGIEIAGQTTLEEIIRKNPFISEEDAKYHFKIDSKAQLLDFYRFNLEYEFRPLNIMLTDFYQDSIDKEFLAEVCAFQSGITIPNEYQDDCLYILKRSPSALLYAVTKDTSIAQGRLKGLPTIPGLDKTHADMFIRNLIISFMHDSENLDIIQALATRFKITGVKTETTLSVAENGVEERLLHFKLPLEYAPISGTNIIGAIVPFSE